VKGHFKIGWLDANQISFVHGYILSLTHTHTYRKLATKEWRDGHEIES